MPKDSLIQISFRDGRPLEVSHRTVGFPESSDVTR